MSIYTNEELLLNFVPCLRSQIQTLCLNGKIGFIQLSFDDIKPRPHPVSFQEHSPLYYHQFTVKIPFAGRCLKWELHFNSEDFTFAPDFSFYDDEFHKSFEIDDILENIPTFANWNVTNPYSLTNLIKEVLEFFNKTQLEKLRQENIYERVYNEYVKLTSEGSVVQKDIEMLVGANTVHFLVAFEIDTGSLPEYVQPAVKNSKKEQVLLNPGDDYCNLKICFLKLDGSRVTTALQLSPRLEQTLGTHKELHLPPFSKDTSLVEYINVTKDIITHAINKMVQHHTMKKEYISSLVTICQEKIVEFDNETFCKGTFLCEIEDFYCMVQIDIGLEFPQEKPQVTLYSVYCVNNKKPCQQILRNYPYSPRWSCSEMVERVLWELPNAITQFKHHSH